MNKSTIGRRYASALFQLLDQSGLEPARSALRSLTQGLEETPALKHVLASPVFKFEEKQAVLEELCQSMEAPPVVGEFLKQLLRSNRGDLLPEISHSFGELVDQQKGIQHVQISSAKPLDVTEQEQVKRELTQTLGQKVDVRFEVEPRLIGGLIIYIGSLVFDNTVKGRLASIQHQLTKG